VSEPPPALPPPPAGGSPDGQPELTDEQRMLVNLRDVLYEGSWDDFRADLEARRDDRPHVFDTVSESSRMPETIERHLRVVDELERWEQRYGRRLRGST
jgi:hypothetical protein